MITPPEVVTTPAQTLAVIRLTVPAADMRTVIGPAVTVGPETTPDPAGWRTQLERPLAGGV